MESKNNRGNTENTISNTAKSSDGRELASSSLHNRYGKKFPTSTIREGVTGLHRSTFNAWRAALLQLRWAERQSGPALLPTASLEHAACTGKEKL